LTGLIFFIIDEDNCEVILTVLFTVQLLLYVQYYNYLCPIPLNHVVNFLSHYIKLDTLLFCLVEHKIKNIYTKSDHTYITFISTF